MYINTYGWLAIAALLMCILSGILLAIPFDIEHPFVSISSFLISNPFASYTRNIHYWSAQLFFVFTLLHIYDHLQRSNETSINSSGVWFRLTLSVIFLGYVMISGFMLKADADSLQAKRILASLLESIPWIGSMLRLTFIGSENNWQLLYIQHISTATIILLIAIYDHVHTIWVNIRTLLIVSLLLGILSWLFRAPIVGLNETVMKGPWYFVGLQEILHWISYPWIALFMLFMILCIIYLLPRMDKRHEMFWKKFLLGVAGIYILFTLTGYFFRGNNWELQWPWKNTNQIRTAFKLKPVDFTITHYTEIPKVQGQPEGCLVCHKGMKGLSESHSESIAGCTSCHLGDPFTLNKDQAHKSLELVPGNLSNAATSCGNTSCHPQIVERIQKSLMVSNSGIVSVDRYIFGESSSPDEPSSVHHLSHSAADQHLRNLCAGCHLGNEKNKPGKSGWLERGGGCNACHLTYTNASENELILRKKYRKDGVKAPVLHPRIDIAVSNEKCSSCHSRSGRISMNYEGWNETTLTSIPSVHPNDYKMLPDGRVFESVKADVHFIKSLACIDCHGSYELMGNGNSYAHEEDAVKIQCEDCHPKNSFRNTGSFADTDRESQLLSWLRKINVPGTQFIRTVIDKLPIINTDVNAEGKAKLTTKLSGLVYDLKIQSESCNPGTAHRNLSCNACHSAWSPQCIGCHNSYEKQSEGFDMLANSVTKGTWVEYAGKYIPDEPVLGISMEKDHSRKVQTMIPGMILSIDKASFSRDLKPVFKRLYAPSFAHTTQRESRSCSSCHANPLALGYGRGQLTYTSGGKWIFEPKYAANPNDGLPEDAWIGFLKDRKDVPSTRTNYRPFNSKEQKQILLVGACLSCHDANSWMMKQSLFNFKEVLAKKSSNCRLPVW